MIDAGARPCRQRWAGRSPRESGELDRVRIVRVGMGVLRYGGDEWWRGRGGAR